MTPSKRPLSSIHRLSATALAAALMLAACGGTDDDPVAPPVAPATRLAGVVATGAAMAGATVIAIDGDTSTVDPAAVTAAVDGSYSIDVSALRGPIIVRAEGSVDGASASFVAVVPGVTTGASNVANVTPLTHAIAALMAPGGDPLTLLVPATLNSSVTTQRVADATALLVNTLATDPAIAAALGSGFNPLSTAFNANGSGIDAVLDRLEVAVSASGISIVNSAAPVGESGVPASVVLTAAQMTTPSVVPTLPPSAPAADLPTAANLAQIGQEMQACLALPLAQRVTLDAAGIVTAVVEACRPDVADWRSNGRNWAEEVGQNLLAKSFMSNARFGTARVVFTAAAPRYTDAKTFKHPYCNDASCVVVRYPMTTASGQATSTDWVLGKVGGVWKLVGNQRPYRAFVDPRMYRKLAVNRSGAAPGSTVDPYFLTDRFESSLRLAFDLTAGDTATIRSVRFTGPGLPTAGVTLFRSQRCATDDRMAITRQNGSTRTQAGQFIFWTGGSATDFVLDAARLDGSALAMPTPVLTDTSVAFQDYSPAPVANQAATLAAWSQYKVEIFRFAALSDEPDEVLYVRTGTGAENAAMGTGKAWPTMAASFIESFLKPAGSGAGELSALSPVLSWAAAAGTYVSSGYLFGGNFQQLNNVQGENANYSHRARIDFEPMAFGDLSATAFRFAGAASGASLSSSTANSGTNPNPRCGATAVTPLTESTSDYREAGIFFRDATTRNLYGAIWYWDN